MSGTLTAWSGRWRAALPMLAGLVLFALAIVVIHRELAGLDLRTVMARLEGLKGSTLLLAVLATAGSYAVLTWNDGLALRWIGRPLPQRRVALAAFTSYALAHNVGFAVLSGGAMRYRLYGGWGLGMVEVAKITAFVSMTTTLGMTTIMGVAGLGESGRLMALARVPSWVGPALGAALLLVPAAYLALAAGGVGRITVRGHVVAIPALPIALGQIGVTLTDNLLAAMALYVLLPEHAGFGPLGFLGLFLFSNLIGLVSNVPGGVGVFDAVILLAVPDAANGGTAAALVAFRLIYYLLPLLLAGLLLALRQFHRPARRLAVRAMPLAPALFSVLVFASGVVLLVSGATPANPERADWLNAVVPLGMIEVSHFLGSVVGVVLLLVADGLRRRLDGAWLAACVCLAAGIVFSLLKGLDYEEAAGLALTLAALVPCRPAFDRRARLSALTPSPGWLLASAAALAACVWLGFFAYRHLDYAHEMWWTFVIDGNAPRFLRASVGAVAVLLIATVRTALRPAPSAIPRADAAGIDRAAAAIGGAEGATTAAWLAVLGDKRLLFSASGRSFLMFGIQGTTWLALGEPVGAASEREELLWTFAEAADRHGGQPAFYQIPPEAMPDLAELGLAFQKLGEQAYVPIASFDLRGPGRAKLRQTHKRGRRDGLAFEVVPVEAVPVIMDELRGVSDGWLKGKSSKEKGFSLGRFDPAYIRRFPVAVLRREGRIVAFANVWATPDRHELSVDLMRFAADAPRGAMDQIFIDLMLWGRDQGYAEFDMGMAPMAGLEGRRAAPMLSKAGALLFRHGEHFYNFQGLRAYKEKFDPVWRPRYLAARPGMGMVRALADATLLIGGGVMGIVRK
ncbi:MAG: bifunctional lysylphosphatidylglycerol flippase/synthetase MprF [Geminicoccaceae bacterium]|nr:bifunctional lysylphosphatidylglycerol flippase/synthetase MprF [Geminicoccaceae bacterium]